METALFFTALMVSILTNLYLARKLSDKPTRLEVIMPEPQVFVSIQTGESQPGEVQKLEPVVAAAKKPDNNGSRHAWVNRTSIPLNETNFSPSPGKKPPVPGPLERPAGFV